MANQITAKKAKELAGPSKEEMLETALDSIEEAAKAKKRSVNLLERVWVYGAYDASEDYLWLKGQLTKRGFKVEFYYRELQFVDMYTIVRW